MRGRLERWLWVCAVALGLALTGVAAWRVAVSPAGVILPRAADAPWIAARAPVTAQVHQWRELAVPVVSFVAVFEVDATVPSSQADQNARADQNDTADREPLTYRLDVRALGDFSLFLNGLGQGCSRIHGPSRRREGYHQ